MVTESDPIVAETAARIFADLADPQTINRAGDDRWQQSLWRALEEAGLPLAWVPEQQGGAGASLGDGFAVLGAAGRVALGVPLAETLLAGWLLARAKMKSPEGAMTIAPVRPLDRITLGGDATLSGRALGILFAADVRHIAVLADSGKGAHVALVDVKACRIDGGKTPAGDSSNTVTFERIRPLAIAPANIDRDALMLVGAVARSVQTAGALVRSARRRVLTSDTTGSRLNARRALPPRMLRLACSERNGRS